MFIFSTSQKKIIIGRLLNMYLRIYTNLNTREAKEDN